jgi:hypothetical protein
LCPREGGNKIFSKDLIDQQRQARITYKGKEIDFQLEAGKKEKKNFLSSHFYSIVKDNDITR